MRLESEAISGIGKAARVIGGGFLIMLVSMLLLTRFMSDKPAAITSVVITLVCLLTPEFVKRKRL